MSKTLKDLNWSLFIVNMLSALALGVGIALASKMTIEGAAVTIVSIAAKDAVAFFSDAKRVLSE